MSIIDEAFNIATAGFNFEKLVNRLRGGYVRRRAEYLTHQSGGWTAGKLAAQLKAELAVVADYLKSKDALIKGTESTTPAHLNLTLTAIETLTGHSIDLPRFAKVQEEYYRANREYWVSQIVWRAVAIHSDKTWKTWVPLLSSNKRHWMRSLTAGCMPLSRCTATSTPVAPSQCHRPEMGSRRTQRALERRTTGS